MLHNLCLYWSKITFLSLVQSNPTVYHIPNPRQMFVFHAEYRYAHLRYRVAKDQLSDYIHCLVISRVKDQKPKTASESQ